jgi:raffinose/stachyose/melibiose transport system permease protein
MARRPLRSYGFLLMLAPALVLYTAFVAYPFVSSLGLSFYEWPGIGPKKWVGLANYAAVLTGSMSREFLPAVGHNLYFFGLSWVQSMVPALVLALGLAAGLRGTNAFKAIFFIPNTLSIVIVGFLWGLLLNPQWGIVNQSLKAIGLGALARPWLGDTSLAFPVIITVNSWRGMGFYVLVFLAGIVGVSREIPEAGRIDGASELQIALRLVLPQLLSLVGTLTMLKLIWSFSVFDIVFAMEGAQAGPAGASDVLGTLFYRIAFGGLGASQIGMGLGAAVVTLTFLVVFPVSIIYVFIVDRRAEVSSGAAGGRRGRP